MKNLIVIALVVVFVSNVSFAQSITTETQAQANDDYSGVSVQRVQFNSSFVNFKYDNKTNINDKKVNDVVSIFSNELIKTENFTMDLGYIGLLDYQQSDEHFLDIYMKKKFKNLSVSLELGRGIGEKQKPRDYAISRISHQYFTVEAGLVTKRGYSNMQELAQDRYYWGALHNEHYFVAIGNEITRTWALASTKGFANFGNFTFVNYDRANGDFWFRSQTGILSVNQSFFSQENCVTSASYLMVPPFHYIWFSPVSTKGLYAFRLDAKKTNGIEKKDVMVSRQFGQIGQFAIGLQNQIGEGNGVVAEYFNTVTFGNLSALVSLRYESLGNRGTAFLRTIYNL